MEVKQENVYNVQAVERALFILNAFTADQHEWTLTDLAREVKVSKSTVFRIATTLQNYQYLKLGEDGFYRLGTEIYRLSAIDGQASDMKSEAQAIMQGLREKYNETVVLTRYMNHRAMCLAKMESQSALKITSTVGAETRLFSGATGKVIVAYLPESELERALSVQEALYDAHYNREFTKRSLQRIRQDGYSFSSNEVDRGVSAIAGPIFDHNGRIVGSVSLAGPNFRFDIKTQPDVVEDIQAATQLLSQRLGFKGTIESLADGATNAATD